jgi:hypothetical protein
MAVRRVTGSLATPADPGHAAFTKPARPALAGRVASMDAYDTVHPRGDGTLAIIQSLERYGIDALP